MFNDLVKVDQDLLKDDVGVFSMIRALHHALLRRLSRSRQPNDFDGNWTELVGELMETG